MKTETKHTETAAEVLAKMNADEAAKFPRVEVIDGVPRIYFDPFDLVGVSLKDLLAQRDELREACKAIASLAGKTLLGDPADGTDYCEGYSKGANLAFEEAASFARAALAKCEPQTEPSTSFSIFVDRGDGKLSNDGCWGGEHNHFESRESAREAITKLAKIYDDCDWVICDRDNKEIERCGKGGFSVRSPQAFPKGRWT